MPDFIVKPTRDEDFYVVWSTVVDAPTYYGSRADLPKVYRQAKPERLDRADEYGTSMCDPDLPRDRQWYGWHDDNFLIMEVEIANRRIGGSYRVPRVNLRAMCERLGENGRADVSDLVWFDAEDEPIAGGA